MSESTGLAALWHRWTQALFALPPRTTDDGRPIAAVRGVVESVLNLLDDPAVTHLGVARDHYEPFAPHGFGAFRTALLLIFWAYAGFELTTIPAAEVATPAKTIPRAQSGQRYKFNQKSWNGNKNSQINYRISRPRFKIFSCESASMPVLPCWEQ